MKTDLSIITETVLLIIYNYNIVNNKRREGAFAEEQNGTFQDNEEFEHCYQGLYKENMMSDYIWQGLLCESIS